MKSLPRSSNTVKQLQCKFQQQQNIVILTGKGLPRFSKQFLAASLLPNAFDDLKARINLSSAVGTTAW